jgi:Ca2+-binding RTX toxin-like protein
VLVAGTGHNLLVGGAGANTFVFRTLGAHAQIADFVHGMDKLEFAKSVFKSADHLDYDAATGALFFDPEAGGWSQPVHFATLAPHLHLTHSDFLFV